MNLSNCKHNVKKKVKLHIFLSNKISTAPAITSTRYMLPCNSSSPLFPCMQNTSLTSHDQHPDQHTTSPNRRTVKACRTINTIPNQPIIRQTQAQQCFPAIPIACSLCAPLIEKRIAGNSTGQPSVIRHCDTMIFPSTISPSSAFSGHLL